MEIVKGMTISLLFGGVLSVILSCLFMFFAQNMYFLIN